MKNPYTTSFGKIPKQYISRDLIVDDIIGNLMDNPADEQVFKITGIRGSGKTVLLTEIERQMSKESDWIVLGIRSNSDIMREIIARLYSEVPFLSEFIDKTLNLSVFGIGLTMTERKPVASIDYALEKILESIKSKGKKVLITIDEARNTKEFVDFIQAFQIFIRKNLPVYMIAAGLYKDIESIEDTEGLTFFWRASKYEMNPLNCKMIALNYKEILGVSDEIAKELAEITKGYAYAYQALGKYMWDSEKKEISPKVLIQLDEALSEKVYKKIWSELSHKERWFLQFIAQKDHMNANELLEATKASHSEWSGPRKNLADKGIIDVKTRGKISVKLPRLKEFVEMNQDE